VGRFPRWVYGAGDEPDARFSLANERTFLAWIRTSLALSAPLLGPVLAVGITVASLLLLVGLLVG
jgi:putative membrane protein